MPEFKNKLGKPAHTKSDGSDWSPAQWLQTVVGELGEYANIRKKFERGDICEQEFKKLAAEELADVITYLDILAGQIGIELDAAVIMKFNAVSIRVGSAVRITNSGLVTNYGDI
jgi:NTP pyrophosphatase (non-canonical NTP hydrolase)